MAKRVTNSPRSSDVPRPRQRPAAPASGRSAASQGGAVSTEEMRAVRHCLCFHARRTARVLTQIFDRHLAAAGVKQTQFTLLSALVFRDEPPTLTELGAYLRIEQSALSRNVSLMVRAKLLTTQVSTTDRRERVVHVTALGRKTFERAFASWRLAQEEVAGVLGRDDYARTLDALRTLPKRL